MINTDMNMNFQMKDLLTQRTFSHLLKKQHKDTYITLKIHVICDVSVLEKK